VEAHPDGPASYVIMPMTSDPICVARTDDVAGEGAVWHSAHEAVYWTDINRFLIHRFTPNDSSLETWSFTEPVTAVTCTARDDVLAVVMGSQVILWQPATNVRLRTVFRLEEWPYVRLNDARADPHGRLWVGSMRNNVRADGSEGEAGGQDGKLYRIDSDGSVSIHRQGIGIANTVAWSPSGRRFYFGDTLANVVWVYDYDGKRGQLSNERPFLHNFERGLPDGSTVDREGYLWNCRWGGGCIIRVRPNGVVDRVIEMPVEHVTTCTFGGPNLHTLYVTTARGAGTEHDPLAGGLYAIDCEVGGVPESRFRVLPQDDLPFHGDGGRDAVCD